MCRGEGEPSSSTSTLLKGIVSVPATEIEVPFYGESCTQNGCVHLNPLNARYTERSLQTGLVARGLHLMQQHSQKGYDGVQGRHQSSGEDSSAL